MNMSFFVPVCMGRVAVENEFGSGFLEVMPVEMFPGFDGELTNESETIEYGVINGNGEFKEGRLDFCTTLPCNWLPDNTNSVFPPSVKRGTRVVLFRKGDADEYYWRDAGLDQNLQRLQTYIFVFSGNPKNESQDKVSLENSYIFEFSTHTKKLYFTNSQLNKEKRKLELEVDFTEATFHLLDNQETEFFIDFVNQIVDYTNPSKSHMRIENDTLLGVFPKSIDLKTKKYTLVADESISMTTKATKIDTSDTFDLTTTKASVKASDSHSLETGAHSVKSKTTSIEAASSATIKSGIITNDGPVIVTKTLNVSLAATALSFGVSGGGAGISSGGALTAASGNFNGAVNSNALTVSGAINCGSLTSAGVVSGNPTLSGGAPVKT